MIGLQDIKVKEKTKVIIDSYNRWVPGFPPFMNKNYRRLAPTFPRSGRVEESLGK